MICACDQCIKIERQTPGAQPSALTGRDSAKRLRHSLHGSTAGFLGPSRTGDFARNDEEVLFPQWRADLRAGRWCKFKLTGRNSGVAGALVSRNDAVAIWLEHVGPLGKEIVAQVQQQLLENTFHRGIARRELEVATLFRFVGDNVKGVFNILQVKRGRDRGNGGIKRRAFGQ